ncbi:MAG: hypothetical protein ABIZ04_11915 [Opitutus sp.]
MRSTRLLLLMGFATVHIGAAHAESRSLVLNGTITNTTIEVSSGMRLHMAIAGETVTATIKTELPLAASGTLRGRWLGGWCTLEGTLKEGFLLRMRGIVNAQDFRGTYVVDVPGSTAQFGRFHLTIQPSTPTAKTQGK